jgi:signal transduction histidine kinase
MRKRSIRGKLLIGVAAVQLIAAIVATILVVHHERRYTFAMLNASLVDRAAMLKAVIEPPDAPIDTAILHRELLQLPRRDVYLLTQAGGKVVASSGISTFDDSSPYKPSYFIDESLNGRRYRFFVEHGITLFDEDAKDKADIPKLNLVYGAPLGGAHETIQFVTWAVIGTAFIILLFSLAAVSWVVRAGMRPVVDLADRAARIDANSWEWETQEESTETQELEPLSRALQHLVERLRGAFERERQFSADAAHEMKTAVAIVKSTLQLTLEREGEASDYRTGVERALDDVDRMQSLVTGMLQLAKVEGLAGAAPSGPNSADVSEQIAVAAHGLEPLLEAREMNVDVQEPSTAIVAKLAAERLQLILKNLLDNAIHYSPPGSTIHVTAHGGNNVCTISIRDEGCGIEPEAMPHIFERFYRGDASRSRESGGAGIGLAIVHAAVRMAGGTVVATSRPGAGSTFTVTLPAGPTS